MPLAVREAPPVEVRTVTACRACQSDNFTTVLDLGNLCISGFLAPGDPEPDRAPLEMVRCGECTLVQLRHTVDRQRLYGTYYYRSAQNETMVEALRDVVTDAMTRVKLEPGDSVLDIGSNDGTLLSFYPPGVHRIGFDPSDIAREAWLAKDFDYDLIRSFFPTDQQHVPRLCKIITSIAQIYNVDDLAGYIREVKRWLHPEGVFVMQFQDLGSMLACNGLDNVCHEHLTYPSLLALSDVLRRAGLMVTGFQAVRINGGSLRVSARHRRPGIVYPEIIDNFSDQHSMDVFTAKATALRHDTMRLLDRLVWEGRKIYGIGASTKFNTLAEWYGITPEHVTAIGERNPAKWGKRTAGTRIPIVNEEQMRDARPDYLLVGAWQYLDVFAERECDLMAQGTRLIVPLPTLRIVG